MKSPPVSRMALDPEERKKNKRAKKGNNTMKARLLKGKRPLSFVVLLYIAQFITVFFLFYLTQNSVAKSVGKC